MNIDEVRGAEEGGCAVTPVRERLGMVEVLPLVAYR